MNRRLSRRGLLLGSLAAGALGAMHARVADATELVIVGNDGWLYPAWEHIDGIPVAAVQDSANAVAAVHELLARRGIALCVALAPSKARIYPNFLPAGTAPSVEFESHYPRVMELFGTAGVRAPDVLAPMLELRANERLYMRTDSHWTGHGAELAAEQTAAALAAGAPPATPRSDVPIPRGWTELDVDGDLVPLLPERLRKNFGREPLMVRTFDTGSDLLEPAEPATVAVVGNSYARPVFGFAQMLSYRLQQPVELFWRIGSIGPWRCLTDFVDQLSSRRRAALKTIVWQYSDYMMGSGPVDAGAWGTDNAFPSLAAWLEHVRAGVRGDS
ncbi:MAG: alginate O-acetyltransferase AlgX-related protein, partial [Vulcanimicrobiaceae bacterium]